jgi:hypothetical protein
MTGSVIIGLLTDQRPFQRRKRALVSCLAVFLLTAVVWGAGLGLQVQFTRNTVAEGTIFHGQPLPWDLKMASAAGGPIVLLMACKFLRWTIWIELIDRLHRRRYLPGIGLLHHVSLDQRYVVSQVESTCADYQTPSSLLEWLVTTRVFNLLEQLSRSVWTPSR